MRYLSRATKVGYGAADLGLSAVELLLQFYLFEFATRVVGLSAAQAGWALGLAVVWDAITDPLMGWIADRTRSRWGPYRPWIALGAVLLPLALGALFTPPELVGRAAPFLYVLGLYAAVNTAFTLIGIPHLALGGVLSPHSHERTEIYGWRLVFGTVGLFAGILLPLVAAAGLGATVSTPEGLAASRSGAAWGAGLLVLASAAWTLWATRRAAVSGAMVPIDEDSLPNRTAPPGFEFGALLRSWRELLLGRAFRWLLLTFVLIALARAINSTLALPYYTLHLGLPEAQVQGLVLGVFALCIVLSVGFWVVVSRRWGKKRPALAAVAGLGLMTSLAYPAFPAGSLVGPVLAAILGGVAVGAIILFESMVTDVAAADRARSGVNREAQYFGFWRMAQKAARSLGLAATGMLAGPLGFDPVLAATDPQAAERLAWAFGPGVGVLFLLAAVVGLRHPDESEAPPSGSPKPKP